MPVIPVPGLAPVPPGADGWCGWDVDPTDICAAWITYSAAQQDAALNVATTIMWAATGRRFGACEITIRPCQSKERAEAYRAYPAWWTRGDSSGMPYPFLMDGVWRNCGCGVGCCCAPRCEITLDGPVSEVVEVMVGGIVLDPTEYRVDVTQGSYRLVRMSEGCWPTCQDFNEPGDGEHAFQVTYGRGVPTPQSVLDATAILACSLGKRLAGGDCGLPPRVSSLTRQGVTADFIVSEIDVDTFTTGIDLVDMVIRAQNPSRRTRPPVVLSPDMPTTHDRQTVIGGP